MSGAGDWTTLPLAGDGRSLVEASAGTGKTWTIAALYLRLLLEQDLAPRRIVVATFTNAAAAELSERLRGRLLWALAEALRAGPAADGETRPDRAWLHARWHGDEGARARDVRRLQAALTGLDGAPVSTLHALCARILAEHPFAAGAPFRGRALVDARSLQAALATDLWRVIAQGPDGDPLVRLARAAGIARKDLERYLPVLLQPGVALAPASPAELRAAVEAELGDAAAWAGHLQAVLAAPGVLRKDGKLGKAWRALSDALLAGDGSLADVLCTHRDTLREAEAMTGVNKSGKDDPAVQALTRQSARLVARIPPLLLDRAGHGALRGFLAAAGRWCRQAMQARLDAAGQATFDQLLEQVRAALAPRDGQRVLADALHAAWPVALVDEFQDTDPVQFAILDAIYRDGGGAPRGRLVMIGDPKQAIYRFRGGDIEAYARARADVADADRLTLDTNFRSSRAYVGAVNAFYQATGPRLGPPQAGTEIFHEPVQAAGRRDREPLRDASGRVVERPLVVHELPAFDGVGRLETLALRACAAQVARLLAPGAWRIGERPLAPGDLAVLLPGHAQIASLAALLKGQGIPCVTGARDSVFESATARELRLVLHAAQHAQDPRALRAALATRLLGGSLAGLAALRHDPLAWDDAAGRFRELHARLERDGPLAVVAALLEAQAGRLLATVAGERMLTDLRHLGELLQEAWTACGGGERLLAWFARQAAGDADDEDAGEARALRLESDAERVRLMTLHASKGLEFNVVLLPLMWKHGRAGQAAWSAQLLADADGVRHLVLGPARAQVAAQEYEERFRVLYVALTRAIHACHLFVAAPQVLADERRLTDVPLNTLALPAPGADGAGAPAGIARLEGWPVPDGTTWQGAVAGGGTRSARPLPAAPPGPLPMRHSFTTLAGGGAGRVAAEAGAAEDEAVGDGLAGSSMAADDGAASLPAGPAAMPATATFHAELDALAAVAGADFGNALHALLEHRVPGRALTAGEALAALHGHGVRPRDGSLEALAEPLARRLNAVLDARLAEGGPRLADLAAEDMRAELEFDYLLEDVDLRRLRAACEAHGEAGLVPAREQALAGLMNGKLDLAFAHGGRFHVLDYKGNQLARGPRACLEDYAPAALARAMAASGYRLQALLYTVALERHLRERLGSGYRRDRHLGDCWYLFVRATGLSLPDGRRCGVWRHRFGDGLLDAVQQVLGLATGQPA